jgi:fatty acid amide hydrolase 2
MVLSLGDDRTSASVDEDVACVDSIPLTERSASALARAVRMGVVSAREVLEAHIALLERTAPQVNAIAADRYAAARAEADAADARITAAGADEALPPLLGVPCTIKESIAVAGMPNSAGLVARRELRAADTAPAAQRLIDAGAIVMGVTKTSELCLWIETENRVYGRASNPYDPRRSAGGSSGGEGAAVGSGGSPFGLGSDLAGSIRIPAFYCGVFGHKPSPGLVPLTGHFPSATGSASRMLSLGPLTRRAEDLMPLLRMMAGPDGTDRLAQPAPLGDPARVSLDGLRVLITDAAYLQPISRELLAAREQAAGALAAAGARIERISLRKLRLALEPYLATLTDGGSSVVRAILAEHGVEAITLRNALRSGGVHTVPTRLLALADVAMGRIPDRRMHRAIAWGEAFAEELAATIGDGLLLHPPLPSVAPRHGGTVRRPLSIHPMTIFNLAGLPVTQVPMGLNARGLPLGVQVVAGPGRDHVSITAAVELERYFGGWRPPDGTAIPHRRTDHQGPRSVAVPTRRL